jgi:tight adherence protein B
MVPFVLAVCGFAAGLVALVALARGHDLASVTKRTSGQGLRRFDPDVLRRAGLAVGAGVAVLSATRWPAAALATAALVGLWPQLAGGGSAGKRQLGKIEAIATWTESLRDTAAAAAGLEQAIPATVSAAPAVLRRPLRDLAARLDGRVPLPEALASFADDVDDPAADMVVAALSLNARQRAGGLGRILTALAISTRAELEMRRKVEHERRSVRRQAQRIVAAVVGFAALQAVFASGWVQPYSTASGQVVLTMLVAVFLAAFVKLRSLAEPDPPARFLTTGPDVTEIASYKPHPRNGVVR